MDNDYNNRNNPQEPGKGKTPPMWFFTLVVVCIFYVLFSYMSQMVNRARNQEITYDAFKQKVVQDSVDSVMFDYSTGRIYITEKRQKEITYYTGLLEDDPSIYEILEAHHVTYGAKTQQTTSVFVQILVNWILPFAMIYIVMWLVFRMIMKNNPGGGLMGVGKSNAKMYVEKETGVTFKDVAGQDEAKESVKELVDFLHNPEKYVKIGAKLPKGALLVGPPGTGKTLLAKAVAGEAKVPFFSLSGSDFVEMFVGVGASRVRDLFKQATQMAPCIVFIDEVDAIGKSRDTAYGGSNDEREQTLNALLAEMDGFDPAKGVIILAATNRPEVLDKALLRPGRFDRRVIVDKPDLKGRIETLRVHIKNVCINETVNLEEIALATAGAVGSDLANIINEAAILAAKEGRSSVGQADLLESVETVFAGKEKKDRILGAEEKKIVAYHECGHALVTALQKKAEPVQKITIVPRTMGSLGYVMQVPEEEKYLQSKDELITQITSLCAGRAAEELFFDSVTTGASSDIEKATNIARNMIARFGMSDKLGFVQYEDVQSKYLDGRAVRTCAESTSASIDDEIKKLIGECYETAKKIISENRDILEKAGGFLMEKETITGKQFMDIIKELRPGFEEKKQETPGETAGNGNAVIPEAEKTAQNEAKADTASDMAEQKASDEEAEAKPVQTEDQDGI
jgi:cell division protease FtsH